jgi:hypothetical protein
LFSYKNIAALTSERDKDKGMSDFHRQMLTTNEATHDAVVAATLHPNTRNTASTTTQRYDEESVHFDDRRRKAESINRKAGYEKVKISEEGEVLDDKELLRGGLNLVKPSKSRASAHVTDTRLSGRIVRGPRAAGRRSRAQATGDIMRQLEEHDRLRQEQEFQAQQNVTEQVKTRKTESEIANARERYLARKQAAARANSNLPHKPNLN